MLRKLSASALKVVEISLGFLGILAALGILSTVLSFFARQWVIFAISLIIALTGVLLAIVLSGVWPRQGLQFKLHLRDLSYSFDQDGLAQEHVKKFVIHPFEDGINGFQDRFKWTGSGNIVDIEPLYEGHSISQRWSAHVWDFYSLRFPVPLTRQNHAFETGVRIKLQEGERRSIPVLSTGIYEPTDRLIIRVVIPVYVRPANVTFAEYKNYTDMTPARSSNGNYSLSSQLPQAIEWVWEVDNPRLGGKYAISWTWPRAALPPNP